MKKLILVNKKDKIKGYEDKEKCHRGRGILHRAFSVYLFNNKGQLLIQQRSKFKKLWPLYWANTCCSHPRKDEDYVKAGGRRLKEELGFSCLLKMVDKFQYQARYKNIGSENELCAILVGEYNGNVKSNLKETANWKWINLRELKKDIAENPNKYTPWLKIGLGKIISLEKSKQAPKLNSILDEYSKLVEPVMRKLLSTYVDEKNQEIVKYQILTGGKRLRPALVIITCQLLGGKIKDALFPAAGLEILHNYTLIIDDIIDHSHLRRGKPTCWFKFGRSITQCIGIDYSAAIFQAANRSKEPIKISELFAKTAKTVVEGEILDILFEQSGREEERYIVKNRYKKVTQKDYLKMVGRKTATLIQTCCEVGGISAGAKKRELKALRNYGFNLGIGFQISDDILDIFGKEKEFGKKIGNDIKERKLGNIVIFYALKELLQPEKKKVLAILRKKEVKDKDIKEAIKIIKKTEAKEKAIKLREKYIQKAKESLKSLPKNKWNKILGEIADFVIKRQK